MFSSYENIYQLSELFVVTMEWFLAIYQLNVRYKSEYAIEFSRVSYLKERFFRIFKSIS